MEHGRYSKWGENIKAALLYSGEENSQAQKIHAAMQFSKRGTATTYVVYYSICTLLSVYVGELKKERRDFQKKKNSNFDVRTSVCRSRELCSKVFRCQCQCFVGFYQTKNKRRYITSNIEVLFKTL